MQKSSYKTKHIIKHVHFNRQTYGQDLNIESQHTHHFENCLIGSEFFLEAFLSKQIKVLIANFWDNLIHKERSKFKQTIFMLEKKSKLYFSNFVVHFKQLTKQSNELDTLHRAIDLYAGTFLEGFGLPDSVAFDEWQLYETGQLRQQFVALLTVAVQKAEARHSWDEAIALTQTYVALDTLNESAHVQLMGLYARAGQKTAVHHQYKTLTTLLQTELDLDPSPETNQQYHFH